MEWVGGYITNWGVIVLLGLLDVLGGRIIG